MHDIKVKLTASKFSGQLTAVRYSPFGLSLISKSKDRSVALRKNEQVLLKFENNRDSVRIHGVVVDVQQEVINGSSFYVFDVAFASARDKDILGKDNRKEARFILERFNSILITARNPFDRTKVVVLTVSGFSRGGLKLETAIENNFLFPGVTFEVTIKIPKYGEYKQVLVVRHSERSTDGRFWLIGCSLENAGRSFLAALGDYCLSCSPGLTLRDLQRGGFPLRFDSKAITLHRESGASKIEEIVDLRRKAYGMAGTWGLSETDPLEKFRDEFDKYAIHIFARVGQRIVGSTRVVCNDGDLSRSEILRKGYVLPEEVLRSSFVEFSKMCTDPDFRNASVLMRLGMEATRSSIEYGADYIVAIARDYMVPTYKIFGLEEVGQKLQFGDEQWNLMIGHIAKIMRGESMAFTTWTIMATPLIRELKLQIPDRFSLLTILKANIAWRLRPLFERAIAKKRK